VRRQASFYAGCKMTLLVNVGEPNSNSFVTATQFVTYLAQRFPSGCPLCSASATVQEAHLLNAMTVLKALDWKGTQPKRRGILFEATTITIANNIITFEDVTSFLNLEIEVYALAGFPEYVNRRTQRIFNTTPHWLKLSGCVNPENDTFFYPYSINSNSITIDTMYGTAINETSSTNVKVYIEDYLYGAESGYGSPIPFPRRGTFQNNELPSEIPSVVAIAQMELAIADYSSALIKAGNDALASSVSSLNLGGDLEIELDKGQFNNVMSPIEIESPLPEHILTLIRPYLRSIPGVISLGARTSKIMRV
jgi:hypothetical protein